MMKIFAGFLLGTLALSGCTDRVNYNVRSSSVRTYEASGSGFQLGVKNGEQIFSTFSVLTGVPMTNTQVRDAYNNLRSQLPSGNDAAAFSPSNQIAIGKLAVEFCDRLIEDSTLRAAILTTVDFSQNPSVVFQNDQRTLLIVQQLKSRFWGNGLDRIPARTDSDQTLLALTNDLKAGVTNNTTNTRAIIKGVCTAVLAASPVTLL
ncbi:MAG: hypothetical protein JNL01_12980 [Bdellovibrionales bacterium]|nr:hypothetical protein [Bdellovibrionales bacterium]